MSTETEKKRGKHTTRNVIIAVVVIVAVMIPVTAFAIVPASMLSETKPSQASPYPQISPPVMNQTKPVPTTPPAPQITFPAPPTGLNGSVSGTSLILTWNAPSNNGGSPITSYKIFKNGVFSGTTNTTGVTISFLVTFFSITIVYKVKSVNSMGDSIAFSNEYNFFQPTLPQILPIPQAVAPAPPTGLQWTGVSIVGQNLTLTLKWNAPLNNGGSPITGYNIYNGAVLVKTVGNVLSTTVSFPYVKGKFLSLSVKSVNSIGQSILASNLILYIIP